MRPKKNVSNYVSITNYILQILSHNEEQGDTLDTQLKEERETMTESEARFEDIARKLATLEAELERSLDRCTTGKIRQKILMNVFKIFF